MSQLALSPALGADLPPLRTALRAPLRLAALGAVALLATLVAWAALTPLTGAVIARGQVVVPGENRRLQHLDGGIVSAIHVRNGQQVQAGEVLIELDRTLLQTNLGIARSRLAEALALQGRLRAEQQGLPGIDLAALHATAPAAWLSEADLAPALAGQGQIMAARSELLQGQHEQLSERIAQLRNQAEGLRGQLEAQRARLAYVEENLANVERLSTQGLVPRNQLLDLQGQRAELQGQIAQAGSDLASVSNGIRDAEVTLVQADRQFQEEVATDLREASAQIEELVPQIVTYAAQLDRVELRAPVAGIVHELSVSTVGGVVAPGETVLQIVPTSDAVEFELRLDPASVDQVHPGQDARLKLTAFDPRRTPEIFGSVAEVSPATVTDPRSGQSYYRLRVAVPPAEMARLQERPVPGMPVEAFLATGERSALSWLVKPLIDHLGRAFRED